MMLDAFLAGLFLGLLYLLGLWRTTRSIVSASHPVRLLLVSCVLRMLALLLGVYWIMGGSWQRLIACSAGIFLARIIAVKAAGFHGKSSKNYKT